MSDDYSRHGDIYLALASQLTMQKPNDSDEMEGTECQGRQEKASEQNIWKLIVIQSTAQPCQEVSNGQESSSLEHFRKLHL